MYLIDIYLGHPLKLKGVEANIMLGDFTGATPNDGHPTFSQQLIPIPGLVFSPDKSLTFRLNNFYCCILNVNQILIRYLGLGWEKAYHPWSRNKHVYTLTEHMEHFVKVVLPLANTEVVPDQLGIWSILWRWCCHWHIPRWCRMRLR